MALTHERLDIYQLSLDFVVLVNQLVETVPRGKSHLSDQLMRAATSTVVNLAEGASDHTRPDKRRHYLSARGAATESAALLDVCARLKLIDEPEYKSGKEMLARVVATLVRLTHGLED